ncbi:MAG: hypothetical protein PVJ49_11500 [Acidobacteriota bacterium]
MSIFTPRGRHQQLDEGDAALRARRAFPGGIPHRLARYATGLP